MKDVLEHGWRIFIFVILMIMLNTPIITISLKVYDLYIKVFFREGSPPAIFLTLLLVGSCLALIIATGGILLDMYKDIPYCRNFVNVWLSHVNSLVSIPVFDYIFKMCLWGTTIIVIGVLLFYFHNFIITVGSI